MGGGGEDGGGVGGFWEAALGEVFAAAAASAERGNGLFEERGHVVGLAGGLGEDQRGLR